MLDRQILSSVEQRGVAGARTAGKTYVGRLDARSLTCLTTLSAQPSASRYKGQTTTRAASDREADTQSVL